MSVGAAIDARWIGAGLESSICKLFLGSGYVNEKAYTDKAARIVAGTPESENVGFPRAEFAVMKEREIKRTVDCVIYEQNFFLYVWTNNEDDLTSDDGFIEQIRQAFNNGHTASVGPFKMTNATVSRCVVEGSEYYPVGHNDLLVFLGEIHGVCQYQRTNSFPDSSGS
jgi:hypothetical protein